MKNITLLLLLFASIITQAQIVNIPDANFKDALLNHDPVIDTNGDGEIQEIEAEAVLQLGVSQQNINSLEGIQSFTVLEILNCRSNQITNLDVSQNLNLKDLNCSENQLTSLDVTQNPNLTRLVCDTNQITSLDVTQNPNLINLLCGDNQLTSLDVTQNSNLEILWCFINQLTSIDVTQNPNLIRLSPWQNQITNLDVTQNPNLERLHCQNTPLISLNVTQNPNLFSLQCQNNQLTSLDVSQNPNLIILACYDNPLLNSLNIKNGNNHNVVSISMNDNPNLTCIQVDDEAYANSQNCDGTLPDWCKDAIAEYSEECVLGVIEFGTTAVTIFPNPVKNVLNISTNQIIDFVKIYSLNGVLIESFKENIIDLSQLQSGIYFLQIGVARKTIFEKIIKT